MKTVEKLLLAVDDSPAALAAARTAVELAAGWQARLRVVNVLADGAVSSVLAARRAAGSDVPERRRLAGQGVLQHVVRLATARGVAVETAQLQGEVAQAVLAEAHRWQPALLVIGLSSHDGPGMPYVGAQTRHILEFSELPVLVVPPRAAVG